MMFCRNERGAVVLLLLLCCSDGVDDFVGIAISNSLKQSENCIQQDYHTRQQIANHQSSQQARSIDEKPRSVIQIQ
jgi:hypothetical protein